MKILIDCRLWGERHTGLGRYTKNLVLEITKSKKINFLLLFYYKNKPQVDSLFSQFPNVKVTYTKIRHYSLKEQFLLPWLLYKLKPDLVHFPHFNMPLFWRGKYVITIHDLIKHHSTGLATTTRHPLIYLIKLFGYKVLFSKAIKNAKIIFTPSHSVKKELLKIYPQVPSSKIEITYEGVGSEFLSKNGGKSVDKIKIKKPFIVYIGNAYPHKNLRRLILAIKMLNLRNFKIDLIIVCGRDVFWNRLKKEIAELKAETFISLPGFLSDYELKKLLQKATALVSPSTMEGFGLPGLEAMACGCPVAVSNIPTFREIYGKAALYFNPFDTNEIIEAIRKVTDKKTASNLSKEGLKQVVKYSWKNCSRLTLKVYQKLISES